METKGINTNASEKRGLSFSDILLIAAGAVSLVSAAAFIIANFVLPQEYPHWIDVMMNVVFVADVVLSLVILIASRSVLPTLKLMWKVASSGWKLFGLAITWWGLLFKVVAFIITAWVALVIAVAALLMPIIPVAICRFRETRTGKQLGELFAEDGEEDEE